VLSHRHDISATFRDLGLTLCVLCSRFQREADKDSECDVQQGRVHSWMLSMDVGICAC